MTSGIPVSKAKAEPDGSFTLVIEDSVGQTVSIRGRLLSLEMKPLVTRGLAKLEDAVPHDYEESRLRVNVVWDHR